MRNEILIIIFLILTIDIGFCQLSSMDIRSASGHGPYPITISAKGCYIGSKRLFREFINSVNMKSNYSMAGFGIHIETVVVDPHFLRIGRWEGLNISGGTIGIGYMSFWNRVSNKSGLLINLNESFAELNLGYRINFIYPFTFEFQGGPILFASSAGASRLTNTSDNSITRVRVKKVYSGLEKNPKTKIWVPGLNLNVRLKFLDPAGTEGGIGYFFEYGRVITFGKRNLHDFYSELLEIDKDNKKSWDYGYFSAGLTVPLALRIVNREVAPIKNKIK